MRLSLSSGYFVDAGSVDRLATIFEGTALALCLRGWETLVSEARCRPLPCDTAAPLTRASARLATFRTLRVGPCDATQSDVYSREAM